MRISYIDKLKGLAIIFVVMGHVTEFGVGVKDALFNHFYHSFHMPLFMFLSGLFAYKGFCNWDISEISRFLKKKFLRVMLPFLTIGGGYITFFTDDIYWGYTKVCGVYWFFPALFYCMLAGLVIGLVSSRIHTGRKLLVDLFLFCIILGCSYLVSGKAGLLDLGFEIPYFNNYIAMFPFFYMGALCGKHDRIRGLVFETEWVYTMAVIGYALVMFCLGGARKFAGCFAILMLIQLFKRHDEYLPNVLSVIGTYSLEIYAFHWFMLPVLPSLLDVVLIPQAAGLPNQNFILLLVLSLFFAIPIVLLCICLAKCIRQSTIINMVLFGFKPK